MADLRAESCICIAKFNPNSVCSCCNISFDSNCANVPEHVCNMKPCRNLRQCASCQADIDRLQASIDDAYIKIQDLKRQLPELPDMNKRVGRVLKDIQKLNDCPGATSEHLRDLTGSLMGMKKHIREVMKIKIKLDTMEKDIENIRLLFSEFALGTCSTERVRAIIIHLDARIQATDVSRLYIPYMKDWTPLQMNENGHPNIIQ